MKKIFYLFISVFLLPFCVNAMAYSETFAIGDEIVVNLTDANEVATFNVIKESLAGEEMVTAIFSGVPIPGSPTVFDETFEDHEATSNIDNALIRTLLEPGSITWTHPTLIRLLTLTDLDNMGINKNATGIYEINGSHKFLAPIKTWPVSNPDGYNYWTQSADTSATNTSVYCVTYNESRGDSDIYATLVSRDITSTTNNSECAIRPVIMIDKQYIECNNTQQATPKTGILEYFVPMFSAILLAAGALLVLKRKNIFKQI